MLATCLSHVILVSGVSADEYTQHSIYIKPISVSSSGFTLKHSSASRTGQLDENTKSLGCERLKNGIMISSSVVSGFAGAGIGFIIPALASDCAECQPNTASFLLMIVGATIGMFIVGPLVGGALAPDCSKELFADTQSTFGGRKQQLVQLTQPAALIHTFRW